MPAPIIPFNQRPHEYPPTFEVGDIIWRCDFDTFNPNRERFLAREVRPWNTHEWEVRASRIHFEGTTSSDTTGYIARYYDPVEGASYVPPQPPRTNHKIGVPKNKIP